MSNKEYIMKISPRLECTAKLVKKGSFPADIGTDHAYIPIYLITEGVCDRAIATDVRLGPLERAEKNIRLYGLKDRIFIRQGSGLSPVNRGEIDCAIISGMGGYLICDIMENGKAIADSIDYFILQPIQAPEVLREYLYNNNYKIIDEKLAEEDAKIYQVMTVEHGNDTVEDEIYFEIGKKLIENNDPFLVEFINKKIDDVKKVMLKINDRDSENAQLRLQECALRLKKYEEVLRCVQSQIQ
jgi:tRNA (adenine22-N1)-methyltransferase